MNRISENLFLGNLQAAHDLQTLKQNNITHILQVANGVKPMFPKQFTYKVISVADTSS